MILRVKVLWKEATKSVTWRWDLWGSFVEVTAYKDGKLDLAEMSRRTAQRNGKRNTGHLRSFVHEQGVCIALSTSSSVPLMVGSCTK